MNSIVPLHFGSSDERANSLALGLMRLGAYLDTETQVLAQVLDVAQRPCTARAVEALAALHLESDSCDRDIRDLLQSTRAVLREVFADLRTIPGDADICAPGIPDFDARTRWAGARLQDILATLHWALD